MSTLIVLILVLVPWLICASAMVMSIVTAVLQERENFSAGRFLSGSYFLERYNRKYFWIFAIALGDVDKID
jgi:hypothetical protein